MKPDKDILKNMLPKKEDKPVPTDLVGAKIRFAEEKRKYTIRAHDDRYFICTRKHFDTVMYTIVDAEDGIRGTENLVFCMGFESDQDCKQALVRLQTGQSEITRRNRIPAIVWDVEGHISLFTLIDKLLSLC